MKGQKQEIFPFVKGNYTDSLWGWERRRGENIVILATIASHLVNFIL